MPTPAAAQPNAADVTVARQAFQEGVRAARAGDWETARERFAHSYALNARPSALLNLAGAQAQTGHLVDSAESYREYLGVIEEGHRSRAAAEAKLAEIEPRIPTLTLRLTGVVEGDVVTLDGEALNPALLEGPIPVDPGSRRVAVVRDESEVAEASATLAEGQALELSLDAPLIPEEPIPSEEPTLAEPTLPEPSPTPAETQPPLSPAPQADEEASGSILGQWWFWTIVGVAAVALLAVGIYFAVPPAQPPPNRAFPGGPLEIP